MCIEKELAYGTQSSFLLMCSLRFRCMRPASFLSAFIEKDHMQEIANTCSIVLCDPPKSVKGGKVFIAEPTYLDQQRLANQPPLFTVCWMDADQIISPSLTRRA